MCVCVCVCLCVCVWCGCGCVCIHTRRCAHTFTQTGTYCSKNPTASHSVDRPQRSAGRAGQSAPATPAVAWISESQTGLTTPRARCACGRQDQATHRMSLAAAAASISDWRRFDSPPNERSTMSSFCASCDADACSWVDGAAACWSVLQARSASARCAAPQRSRPQCDRRESISTSKNTHGRKTRRLTCVAREQSERA